MKGLWNVRLKKMSLVRLVHELEIKINLTEDFKWNVFGAKMESCHNIWIWYTNESMDA